MQNALSRRRLAGRFLPDDQIEACSFGKGSKITVSRDERDGTVAPTALPLAEGAIVLKMSGTCPPRRDSFGACGGPDCWKLEIVFV